jgi:hypothetical protein
MSAMFDVNFIHHYLGVRREFYRDKRTRQSHVMVYEALFISWNEVRWDNPFLAFRDDLMKLAKVGSKTTFIGCMHDLNKWGYLRYLPSSSPNVTSMVEMYTLEVISANVQRHIKSGNGRDQQPAKSGNAGGPAPVPKVGQYNTNNLNNSANVNGVSGETTHPRQDLEENDVEGNVTLPAGSKKKAGRGGRRDVPGSLEEVTAFFLSIHSNEGEAAHFYHHYESNDWVKGNGQSVKSWQAQAHVWLHNAGRYARASAGPTPGPLQTPGTPGEKKKYNKGF